MLKDGGGAGLGGGGRYSGGNEGTGLKATEEWEMEAHISSLTEEGVVPERSGRREIDPGLQSECNQIL